MKLSITAALAALLLCASFGFAQDDAAMAEAMKKWQEAGTPGPQHEMLAKYTGEWDVVSKAWWEGPDKDPVVSNDHCTSEMVMDGRYLKLDYTGMMMGQEWKGTGYYAYENFPKKYVTIWMDDMSTGIGRSEGTSSDGGKTIELMGKMSDPMTGQIDKPTREVWHFTDDDHFSLEMYDEVGTDHEFKAMEINFARKK